ncbi:MAG: hypothetical protein RL687_318 [Candidatus Parcubacteria bacterium]
MQNNGNKLRAFIITFVIMGILIAAGYFIFKNMQGNSNETKGDSLGKKFTSLFGLSKPTQLDSSKDINLPGSTTGTNADDTTGSDGAGSSGATDNTGQVPGSGSNTDGSGSATSGSSAGIAPKFNPFPYSGSGSYLGGGGITGGGVGGGGFTGGGGTGTGDGGYYDDIISRKTQCSDGIDNDGDGKKDAADAGCHTDLKASNTSSYFAGWDDEKSENDPIVVGGDTKNKCEVTIVFDDIKNAPNTDKKRMEELLRLFYRIAPNLATAEDIKQEVANRKTYENVISKSKEYTAQCYKERETLGPSRALANGKEYMLESRKTEYGNTTKIPPSETFLPGDKGVSFKTPHITVSDSYRGKYFTEHDGDLIINTAAIKQKDRGGASGAIAAHILQNMHDYGIVKKYIPGKLSFQIPSGALTDPDTINAFKGDENYEKVLKILLRETGRYLETLEPGRRAWSDRSGKNENLETFYGFVGENSWDYWGYVRVKEALNLYLVSSENADTRKVDFGKITWFSGASEFVDIPMNSYKNFEDAWGIK